MGQARAQYGPGPWAGPMGPGHGPGPVHIWARTFFGNSILKNLNIVYIYISLNPDFLIFFQKDARRKMTKVGPKNAPRSLI